MDIPQEEKHLLFMYL